METRFSVGDTVQSRKKHPCGGDRWTVLRDGADVRIRCESCGRIILLNRDVFLRRFKGVVPPSGSSKESADLPDSCQ